MRDFEVGWASGGHSSFKETASRLVEHEGSFSSRQLREMVIELAVIDLEWRWRLTQHDSDGKTKRSAPGLTLAEDYAGELAELCGITSVPLELVEEEYRIRLNWGDQPSWNEYQTRFPDFGERIESRFAAIETEIRNSQACDPVGRWKGKTLGRYIVGDRLGAGGFGLVFRARDQELDRDVAVKIPRQRLSSDTQIESFMSEARMIASLDHSGIVPIYDVGCATDGTCYLVSKLVNDGDLTSATDQLAGDWLRIAELIATIAEALHFAHSNDVIHRDIKPANILIDAEGRPFLTDFGLACRGDASQADRYAGTPAYMSPEQASGNAHLADARSDIFSLGVVTYELLVGSHPYNTESATGLLNLIVSAQPPSPRKLNKKIPVELERICLRSMAKSPKDRYATAHELAEDLRRWSGARRRSALGQRLLMAAVIVLVLLGIAGRVMQARQLKSENISSLVTRLLEADDSAIGGVLKDVDQHPEAKPFIRRALVNAERQGDDRQRVNLNLALLQDDALQTEYLADQLIDRDQSSLRNLTSLLSKSAERLTPSFWDILENTSHPDMRRLRAAVILLRLDPESPLDQRWRQAELVPALLRHVATEPQTAGLWAESFSPLADQWSSSLIARIRSPDEPQQVAPGSVIFATWNREDPARLVQLARRITPSALAATQPILQQVADELHPHLIRALHEPLPERQSRESERAYADRHGDAASQRANFAITLLTIGKSEAVWPLLSENADPVVLNYIVTNLESHGIPSEIIVTRLKTSTNSFESQSLIRALSHYLYDPKVKDQAGPVVPHLLKRYSDPDAAVHVLSHYTIMYLGQGLALSAISPQFLGKPVQPDRNWYLDQFAQDFIVFRAPLTYDIATRRSDIGKCRISHDFAIVAREVSVGQFNLFKNWAERFAAAGPKEQNRGTALAAQDRLTWYEAAAYCNVLSEVSGIPKDQWCYIPNDEGNYASGMRIAPHFLDLEGYRLPTESEWLYACRGNQRIMPWGNRGSLGIWYAFAREDGKAFTSSVSLKRPNRFGLFDMIGNAAEWCHNRDDSSDSGVIVTDDAEFPLLGGSCAHSLVELQMVPMETATAGTRAPFAGCRVARTLKQAD